MPPSATYERLRHTIDERDQMLPLNRKPSSRH